MSRITPLGSLEQKMRKRAHRLLFKKGLGLYA